MTYRVVAVVDSSTVTTLHRIDTKVRRPGGGAIDGSLFFHEDRVEFVPNSSGVVTGLLSAVAGPVIGAIGSLRSADQRRSQHGLIIDYGELTEVRGDPDVTPFGGPAVM